jgi:Homeodomain-like domain
LANAKRRNGLGIGIRQLKRLVRCWRRQGDAGLVSRQRGRASHNRLPGALRTQVTALLRDKSPDFGPTMTVEKLLEVDGIKVSRETITSFMRR